MKSELKEYKVEAKFDQLNSNLLPIEPIRKILNLMGKFNSMFSLVGDYLDRFKFMPS